VSGESSARRWVRRRKDELLDLTLGPRRFSFWQRRGLSVVPNHFYQPVPDVARLPESLWEDDDAAAPGVDLELGPQLALLAELARRFGQEWAEPPSSFAAPGSYGAGDAELLWAMVRRLRPAKVVEVGSGASSRIMAEALGRNEVDGAAPCHVTVIDPEPRLDEAIRASVDQVLARPVQQVGLEAFEALAAGDLLFIDSTHVVATGSDVAFVLLQVLPRLAPGVVVHAHDVFLPHEYPRSWVVDDHVFWNEQHLLQGLLSGNPSFRVLLATHHLDRVCHDALVTAIPALAAERRPAGLLPCSFWFERA
jgi:predicted O-methyltransferase YrrM